MTKLFYAVIGASLTMAALAAQAADASSSAGTSTRTTEAWSDAKVSKATSKCNGMTGTEAAKCIVNIRPEGGGGSSLATAVSGDNVVKTGVPTEEEYMSALQRCDAADVTDKDRCVADVKDRYGRM